MLRPIPVLAAVVLLVATLAGCTDSDDAPLLGPDRSEGSTAPTLAHAIVWPEPSTLKIEIDYVAGRAPTQFSLDELERMLQAETEKSTIEVLAPTEVELESDGRWTPEELTAAHQQTFDNQGDLDRDTVWLHLLFVDGQGDLDDDRAFVGLQQGRFLTVLPDSVKNALVDLGPLPADTGQSIDPAYDQAQAAIVIHETGHAMGLVGKEAPMVTDRLAPQDIDPCRCHSESEDSVMYPNVENFNPVRFVQQGQWSRYSFDADDQADLQALRDTWEP